MENNASTALYDLLVTRDFDPEILDSSGKAVTDPSQAELFSFDWKTENKNYGTVVVLLGADQELEVYYGDNLGRSMESEDRRDWYQFLEQMKSFATRNLLSFELNNLNRLKYTMQGMAAIREGLFEGYYGTRKMSYSDQPKKTKLVIRHDRTLGEGDKRYRHIESLFVETADGERFRVPSRSLMHGKMLARHVAEGGTPYDAFGQHITEIIAEMATMSRFVRAARGRAFEGEAAAMTESAVRHYQALKAKAKRMISQRGYREEREQFDPAAFTDSEVTVEAIRDMFIENSLDQRIEEALPILARMAIPMAIDALSSDDSELDEARQFESWANNLVEGTWALPEGPEKIARLKKLMAEPLPVGPDATNATEQLYDLLGDDELFNQLEELARMDANADTRPAIQSRLKQLGLDNILTDMQPVAEPVQQEDLDTDGVMMTRPSNMSSESVERDLTAVRKLALGQ
jgi:hypothetical protein